MKLLRIGAALFFLLAFFALIWPIYPIFSTARPLILGMPQSLFYVAFWLIASFLALLALYLAEER